MSDGAERAGSKRTRFRDEASDIAAGGTHVKLMGRGINPTLTLRREVRQASAAILSDSDSESESDEEASSVAAGEDDDSELRRDKTRAAASGAGADPEDDEDGPPQAKRRRRAKAASEDEPAPEVQSGCPGDAIHRPESMLVCCDNAELRQDILRDTALAVFKKGLVQDIVVHSESREPTFMSNVFDEFAVRLIPVHDFLARLGQHKREDSTRLCVIIDDLGPVSKKTEAVLRRLMLNIRRHNVVLLMGTTTPSKFPVALRPHLSMLAYTFGRSPVFTKGAYEICPFAGPWKDVKDLFMAQDVREFWWLQLNSRVRPGTHPNSVWKSYVTKRMQPRAMTYEDAQHSGMWEARVSKERNAEDKALARLPLAVGEEVEEEQNARLATEDKGTLGSTKPILIEMPTPRD